MRPSLPGGEAGASIARAQTNMSTQSERSAYASATNTFFSPHRPARERGNTDGQWIPPGQRRFAAIYPGALLLASPCLTASAIAFDYLAVWMPDLTHYMANREVPWTIKLGESRRATLTSARAHPGPKKRHEKTAPILQSLVKTTTLPAQHAHTK